MLSRRLCTALVILQASLAVILYGFNTPASSVAHHLNTQLLALAVVGLVATVAALALVATRREAPADDARGVEDGDRSLEESDQQVMATTS
jgi:hypothetical protein